MDEANSGHQKPTYHMEYLHWKKGNVVIANHCQPWKRLPVVLENVITRSTFTFRVPKCFTKGYHMEHAYGSVLLWVYYQFLCISRDLFRIVLADYSITTGLFVYGFPCASEDTRKDVSECDTPEKCADDVLHCLLVWSDRVESNLSLIVFHHVNVYIYILIVINHIYILLCIFIHMYKHLSSLVWFLLFSFLE